MKRILNHIKHLIYRRKELKRLELCLKVIERAKSYYILKGYDDGMCNAFGMALYKMNIYHRSYTEWINHNIPEFNAKYLTGTNASHFTYWWDLKDIDSRVEAFNKLIDLYETKIKELC